MQTFFREIHSGGRKLKDWDDFISLLEKSRRTCVLTGAGISTLSGLSDFRSSSGYYSARFGNIRVEKLLDISFFLSHPDLFYKWAGKEWYSFNDYRPNIIHSVLALMEKKGIITDGIWTQNIDSLDREAGVRNLYELHGTLRTGSCTGCGKKYTYDEMRSMLSHSSVPLCRSCSSLIRPDIVFYGEGLDEKIVSKAFETAESVSLMIVLGSSLVVNPVASLPYYTLRNGGDVVIVNRDSTYLDDKVSVKFENLEEWGTKLYNYLQK